MIIFCTTFIVILLILFFFTNKKTSNQKDNLNIYREIHKSIYINMPKKDVQKLSHTPPIVISDTIWKFSLGYYYKNTFLCIDLDLFVVFNQKEKVIFFSEYK